MPWLAVKLIDDGRDVSRGPGGLPVAVAFNDEALKWLERRIGKDVEVVEAGHSLKSHRGFFGYMNECWEQYGKEKWPDADAFRAQVSIEVGWTKIIRVMVKGEWVDYIYPRSWKMRKCHAEAWAGIVERGNEWMQTLGAPSFEAWLEQNPHMINRSRSSAGQKQRAHNPKVEGSSPSESKTYRLKNQNAEA